jgi:regulatory protein
VDQPWDEALAQQVEAAAAFDKAMMHAMNGLSRRAMSCWEVQRKLQQKGHAESVIASVMDRLHELGLLDDEAFGRALLRDLQNRQPAGPRLMKQKLAQKGLEAVLIDQLVDEAMQSEDQTEQALHLARQRLKRLQGLPAATRKRRLYGQLARRGFTPETLDQVMQTLTDELTDDE